MRLIVLWSITLGCPQSEPAPVAPAPEPAPEPAEPRLVPPPPPDDLQPVAIVGHGLRIRVYPPFQIAIVQDMLGNRPEGEQLSADDDLIVSWWNVAEPGVGSFGGRGGLYNNRVMSEPVPDGQPTIIRSRVTREDGREVVVFRLGETGSWVELSEELADAGGMLTVERGPDDARWAIEAGGTVTPMEARRFVHSADPASGPGFDLSPNPHQPWGRWP